MGQDSYRPRFHFTPPKMWMNDPNGLIFENGVYHLYYQHNPLDTVWGAMHWGHATSRDLMRWEDQGIVMAPDGLGAIFSGCAVAVPPGKTAVLPQGGLAYLFTHHGDDGTERQSLATSIDHGKTLVKYPGNPVIENDGLKDFRDPKVFWHEPTNAWCMILAGGPVRIYRSQDLVHWTMTQQMDEIQTECPDLFPLETEEGSTLWVLSAGGTAYYLGEFDGKAYRVLEGPIPLDGGDSFYAVQSFSGVQGRTLCMGWMNGGALGPTETWRCAMSLPRELFLEKTARGRRLGQRPAAELAALWGERREFTLSEGEQARLTVDNRHVDVERALLAGEKPAVAYAGFFGSGDRLCRVGYDGQRVYVDRGDAACTDYRPDFKPRFAVNLPWDGKGLILRIVADSSTLEVFGPEGCAISCEVYNGPATGEPLEAVCRAGGARFRITEIKG